MNFDKLFNIAPYSLTKSEKGKILTDRLIKLTKLHRDNCPEYNKILESISYCEEEIDSYEDLPFLPVRLFKERTLKSITQKDIIKTMTSSGTSGQSVSKIFLDRTTSSNQQKALVKIVSDFTGANRMPMIIIDSPSVIRDRKMFSARGAGILGFSIFGSKKTYALNDEMNLNISILKDFLKEYAGQKILLFGFTFIIWQHFYKELVKLKEESGETLDLSNAVLIHGGGWKKLISESVNSTEFYQCLHSICGIRNIHDYYGMVEQTGCIYMQCECGHLHASVFSDIIIRNSKDFSACNIGERGIIQVISTIPESYPGHSLLTEDEGVILGEDDCPCGRKGKYFKIYGRLKNAEIRGCSDTYANDYHSMSNSLKRVQEQDTKISDFSKATFSVGNMDILNHMKDIPPKRPFDTEILSFLSDLSKELMTNTKAKSYPDIITLGFWLRAASLKQLEKRYNHNDESIIKIGKGIAFHIAPSNVPVNYAYSLFMGLLMGNANIVRIPSKPFEQIDIINTLIESTLQKHEHVRPYISLIRYEHDKDINNLLSELCDVRIIWGGNSTVNEIRHSKLSPRATEITFADRYSLAVIDSDKYMTIQDKKRIAIDMYNDTFLTDQNACTAPRAIIWMGNRIKEAKEIFWNMFHILVQSKYPFQPIQGINKLSLAYMAVTTNDSENIGKLNIVPRTDNLIYRIRVNELNPQIMNYKGNSGFFYEFDCQNILQLKNICNSTYCQTIGLIGNPEMLLPLLETGIRGIDRIVPVGQTMDFDMNWDGYNLYEHLTRTIAIK